MPWVEFDLTWNEKLHRRQYREHQAGSKALLRRDAAMSAVDTGHAHYITDHGLKTDKAGRTVDVGTIG
jgi:hypothetical protein